MSSKVTINFPAAVPAVDCELEDIVLLLVLLLSVLAVVLVENNGKYRWKLCLINKGEALGLAGVVETGRGVVSGISSKIISNHIIITSISIVSSVNIYYYID